MRDRQRESGLLVAMGGRDLEATSRKESRNGTATIRNRIPSGKYV